MHVEGQMRTLAQRWRETQGEQCINRWGAVRSQESPKDPTDPLSRPISSENIEGNCLGKQGYSLVEEDHPKPL